MVTFPPTPDNPATAYGDTSPATLAARSQYLFNLAKAMQVLQQYVVAHVGSALINAAPISFTAAQMKASNAKTLVAAPGAGFAIIPMSASVRYTFVTTPFGNPSCGIGYPAITLATMGGMLDQLSSKVLPTFPFTPTLGRDLTEVRNQPLTLITSFPGAIVTAAVGSNAGTGYAVNDTGTLTGGSANATYRVSSVGALGVVTGIVITGAGTAYDGDGTESATATGGAQPGLGINLTINVLTINPATGPGDGLVDGNVLYYTLALP